MKRHLFILIFFIISVGTSEGFVQNRCQWWKIRLKKLQNEKELIQKSDWLGTPVIDLIDNEAERARSILQVFEHDRKNDGTLNHEKKKFTAREIENEVKNVFEALFSLHYLDTLVSETGNRDNPAIARKTVKTVISKMLEKRFKQTSHELVDGIFEKEIDRNDLKTLSLEVFIGRMIKSENEIRETAEKEVTRDVTIRLARKNNTTNEQELKGIIIDSSISYLRECDPLDNLKYSEEALNESARWEEIGGKVKRSLSSMEKLIALMQKKGSPSLEKAWYYYKNPVELEPLVFKKSRSNSTATSTVTVHRQPVSVGGRTNRIELTIPTRPDFNAIVYDMDRRRKKSLSRIKGKEDDSFFSVIEKDLDLIIAGAIHPVKNEFIRLEEEVRLKKTATGIRVVNQKEFNRAKKDLEQTEARLRAYKDRSIQFLQWVSGSRAVDRAGIVNSYKYRVKRDRAYLDYVKSLVRQSVDISSFDNRQTQKKFTLSVRKTAHLFKFIAYSLSLKRSDLIALKRTDLRIIKETRADFLKEIKSSRHGISAYYKDYLRDLREVARKKKALSSGLKEKIAQYEINILLQNAQACVKLYDSLRYAEEAMAYYQLKFKEYKKEIESGTMSGPLEESIQKLSLISTIKDFDRARLVDEYITKKYVKREARMAIARLTTILRYYKVRKIKIKSSPDYDEIFALKSKLGKKIEVRIDSWIMNEANFDSIDKKAAKKLTVMRKRKIWETGAKKRNVQRNTLPSAIPDHEADIDLPEDDLHSDSGDMNRPLAIPRGWKEDRNSAYDQSRGVIKSYSSMDRGAVIRLVKLPLKKSDNVKEITENWTKRSGNNMIKERWGRKNRMEYFWTLSKDKHSNVCESYSVLKEGFVYILSGTTSKNKYNFFKGKLNTVFASFGE
ncbi:MAG: hypothetical protein GY754_40340 [bacterium]|nr:hypothetical protein [bacterium]